MSIWLNPGMSEQSQDSRFSVAWPALSTALIGLTVSSLATLIIIIGIKNVDVLSAVALALAILSFIAQLVVLLFQTQQSNKQSIDSTRVTSRAEKVLNEISTKATSLLSNQKDVVDRLLDALGVDTANEVVDAVKANQEDESVTGKDSGAVDSEDLAIALRTILQKTFEERNSFPAPRYVNKSNRYSDYLAEMDSYPTRAESKKGLDLIKKLSPLQISLIVRIASLDIRKARNGFEPKRDIEYKDSHGYLSDSLEKLGLISLEKIESYTAGIEMQERKLTELGRIVSRILNVSGRNENPPSWLLEIYP